MDIKYWIAIGMITGMLAGLGIQASAQDAGFQLQGIGSAPVPVTLDKMTNIIFPEAIQTGVKVSRDVMAQKVRGVENVIELKALRNNFVPTNLSVYGRDGRLYSFVLHYSQDSAVLNFRVVNEMSQVINGMGGTPSGGYTGTVAGPGPVMLTGLPVDLATLKSDATELASRKAFLNVSEKKERLRIGLAGIYLRDSLQWLILQIKNGSQIGFKPVYARFFIEDKKQVKRKAIQEIEIKPVFNGLPEEVVEGNGKRIALGFDPFTIPAGKRLVIEIAGADGGRTILLRIKDKVLLRARVAERRG
jgi:conjugative transposon TraN protein